LKAGGLMPVAHQTSMVCTTPLGKILAKLMASSGTTLKAPTTLYVPPP